MDVAVVASTASVFAKFLRNFLKMFLISFTRNWPTQCSVNLKERKKLFGHFWLSTNL